MTTFPTASAVVDTVLAVPVGNGGTLTVQYPPGTSKGLLESTTGGVVVINNNETFRQNETVLFSFEDTGVEITNASSVMWPAKATVLVSFDGFDLRDSVRSGVVMSTSPGGSVDFSDITGSPASNVALSTVLQQKLDVTASVLPFEQIQTNTSSIGDLDDRLSNLEDVPPGGMSAVQTQDSASIAFNGDGTQANPLTAAVTAAPTQNGKPPYTALYVGASHNCRAYSVVIGPSATQDAATGLLTVSPPSGVDFFIRKNTGAKLTAIFQGATAPLGVIEAPVLDADAAAKTQVVRGGRNAYAPGEATNVYRSSLRLGMAHPCYWLQAFVGRPWDDCWSYGIEGATTALSLEFLKDFGQSGKKVGFAFYQSGTNSIITGDTFSNIISIYASSFDLLAGIAQVVVVQSLTNFGYNAAQASLMNQLNAWMEQECESRGFVWADWNEAYIMRAGARLYYANPDTSVAEWAKYSSGDRHLNQCSAKAIADTVLLPLLEDYLPVRLNWTSEMHRKYNWFETCAGTLDPLFAYGGNNPSGCVLGAAGVDLTQTVSVRRSREGVSGVSGEPMEWIITAVANEAISSITPDFSFPISLFDTASRGIKGKPICFAFDARIPSGSRFSGVQFRLFFDSASGDLGEIFCGDGGDITVQTQADLGSDEDTRFTVFTNWFSIPETASGATFYVQPYFRWTQADNAALNKGAVLAVSNPRILFREDWALPEASRPEVQIFIEPPEPEEYVVLCIDSAAGPSVIDLSPVAHSLTLTGLTSFDASGNLSLTGPSRYVSFADTGNVTAFPGDFTIEFDARIDTTAENTGANSTVLGPTIVGPGSIPVPSWVAFSATTGNAKAFLTFRQGEAYIVTAEFNLGNIPNIFTNMVRVTLVRQGTSVVAYANGKRMSNTGSGILSGVMNFARPAPGNIGKGVTQSNPGTVLLPRLRLANRALYYSEFTPSANFL